MKPPLFSVIMPVYNTERYVSDAIRSVVFQTERDLELIIIDDGSTDDSLKVLLNWAAQDDRIKLVSRSNSGVSATRNLAANMAWGKWLAFIDSDDVWHPNKLERHRDLHQGNASLGASYARIAFIPATVESKVSIRTQSTVPATPLTKEQMLGENPICTTSNLVVARTLFNRLGGFDETMSFAEDQEFALRLIASGHSIMGIDELLVDYRLNDNGLSLNFSAMHKGWRQIFGIYGDPESAAEAEAIYLRYLARRALRADARWRVAIHYALMGLKLSPAAFFSNPKRGLCTLLSALVGPALPKPARIQLFA